ncbi:hypothetical protein BY458DRAFT_505002 [Sporodiniella umbellata]|nr:hypothetical protein BY458DRAFT_505002 [Sporodiniella umbellata]
MTSELAQDTLKKHVIQKFPTPELAPEGGIWTCPFCQAIDPKVIPYLLETPAFSNEIQEKKIKKIITDHLEEHQSFLYQMLIDQQRDGAYEKVMTTTAI